MTFSAKTARSGWLPRILIICTAASCLALAMYLLNRSSIFRAHGLRRDMAKRQDKHVESFTSSEVRRPAPTIFGENEFRHFLGPLPFGTTVITVTSQDERGGVNTQQIAATIQRVK
jgi:hypothetical protein